MEGDTWIDALKRYAGSINDIDEVVAICTPIQTELESLRAELREAKKDTARLDWLSAQMGSWTYWMVEDHALDGLPLNLTCHPEGHDSTEHVDEDLRKAMDDAMATEPTHD